MFLRERLSCFLVENEGANVNFRCSFTYSEFLGGRGNEVTNIRNHWPRENKESHKHFLITGADL
jgi:hypothetical protein